MNKQEIMNEIEVLQDRASRMERFSKEWNEVISKISDLRHDLRMYEILPDFEAEVEQILQLQETIKNLQNLKNEVKKQILKRSGIKKDLVYTIYGQTYKVTTDDGWSCSLNKDGTISKRDNGRRITLYDLEDIKTVTEV